MRRVDVVIEEFGLKLGRTSQRLTVRRGSELVYELPLQMVRSVRVACGGVSISSDIILACCTHQIPLTVTDYSQVGIGRLSSPLHSGDVQTRRLQLRAVDSARGVEIMRMIVSEKIRAQGRLLKYLERRTQDPESFQAHLQTLRERLVAVRQLEGDSIRQVHAELLGHEGLAARAYWAAWGSTLPEGVFLKRRGRGAGDRVNAMLNYGYAILRGRIWGMIDRAGLDPYAGFLHLDRVGRAGLVFDLMEPYRPIVDDTVGSIIRRSKSAGGAGVEPRHLRATAEEFMARLDAPASIGARRARVAACMQQGVRTLAGFLREEESLALFRWDVRGPKEPAPVRDPLERILSRAATHRRGG